jgi:hypothetical protein
MATPRRACCTPPTSACLQWWQCCAWRLCCRAGRDGDPALSLLYASNQELKEAKKLEKGSRQGATGSVAAYIQVQSVRRP